MLTGDNATVARSTAQALGLDDYRAELLPRTNPPQSVSCARSTA